MATEIERKFKLCNDQWRLEVVDSKTIRQGYLATTQRASTRVRISNEEATLNIKQAIPGTTRLEYEYAIPLDDAMRLLDELCEKPLLEKTRHLIHRDSLTWEIDEFHGDNAGLIVAEVELDSSEQDVPLPSWVGDEVSHDIRYYNVSLLNQPYNTWTDNER